MPGSKRSDRGAFPMRCHPSYDGGAVERFEVRVRRAPGSLALRFRLEGRLDRLAVPAAGAPARRDGLWRHTCFEVFLRIPGEAGYAEFNLSPSGEWAAYRFDAYRSGMRELEAAPAVAVTARGGNLEVSVRIAPVPEPWGRAEALRIGVAAVVEDAAGALAYWALAHPPGAPDFHHPAGFALAIGAAGTAATPQSESYGSV
jgi:hypothetical protein